MISHAGSGQARVRAACTLGLVLELSGACSSCRPEHHIGDDAGREVTSRFWLRNVESASAAPDGARTRPSKPERVELLAHGRIRKLDDAAQPESQLPPEMLEEPEVSSGLALYAQATTDVHLGAPDGPVIGSLHAGTFASVVPKTATHLLVALPWRRTDQDPDPAERRAVTGYVLSSDMGIDPRPLEPPPTQGRLIRDYPPSPLWPTAREGPAFAEALCGEARVLSEESKSTRISQYQEGAELFGWTDFARFLRGQVRCVLRRVVRKNGELWLQRGSTMADEEKIVDLPPNYVRGVTSDEVVRTFLKSKRSVFWLVQIEGKANCEEWTVDRATVDIPGSTPTDIGLRFRRREPIVVEQTRALVSFDGSYRASTGTRAGELRIRGPVYRDVPTPGRRPRPALEDSCETRYGFVGSSSETLRWYPEGPPDESVVAWDPEDEEPWFLTREGCQSFEKRAQGILGSDVAAIPPGETHLECYSPTGPILMP